MKDELGSKIKTKFVEAKAKTHSYLIGGSNEKKQQPKSTKKCVLKRKLYFEN